MMGSPTSPPNRWRPWLVRFLRLQAVVMGSAVIAIFLPAETMAAVSTRLGVGPYVPGPLTDYLTRSLSTLYALLGSLNWITSRDPERYAGVITYMGVAAVVLSLFRLGIDLTSGMPLFWTVNDALGPAIGGFLVLWLQRKAMAHP